MYRQSAWTEINRAERACVAHQPGTAGSCCCCSEAVLSWPPNREAVLNFNRKSVCCITLIVRF